MDIDDYYASRWDGWDLDRWKRELREARNAGLWGVPDWRDPVYLSDYGEYPADCEHKWTKLKWKWEFIRRRDDYRNDFFAAMESLDYNPMASEDSGYIDGLVFEHDGAKKYGLLSFLDPRVGRWLGGFVEEELEYGNGIQFGCRCHEDNEYSERYITITFDLSRDLNEQINSIKDELYRSQGYFYEIEDITPDVLKKRRDRDDKWPLYLRILDARSAGATYLEMAEVLFPDTRHDDEAMKRTIARLITQARQAQFRF